MLSEKANVAQGSIFMHFQSKIKLNYILVEKHIKTLEITMAEVDFKKVKINDFTKSFIECFEDEELLLSRVLQHYMSFDNKTKNLIDQFITSIKDLIFDYIQKNSKNKLNIIDTFVAIDAFWAQINLYLIMNSSYSPDSTILITDVGKLNKLFKILFL